MLGETRYLLASAGFGLLWGGVVALLSVSAAPAVFGGLLASPGIGLLVGIGLRRTRGAPTWLRGLACVAAIYGAAALFRLGVGVADWIVGASMHRDAAGVVLEPVLAYLWGLTFLGYVLVFAPASWLSLWAMERFRTTATLG
jgi:hypothetical protein